METYKFETISDIIKVVNNYKNSKKRYIAAQGKPLDI